MTRPATSSACSTAPAHRGSFGTDATVTNTDTIVVNGSVLTGDEVIVDTRQGAFAPGVVQEADNTNELEINLNTTGDANFAVIGSSGYDYIAVGTCGRVNFTADGDADIIPAHRPSLAEVSGNGGNNDLTANGFSPTTPPADVSVALFGGTGHNTIVGGARQDTLIGGPSDDTFYSVDGGVDILNGGDGFDTATVDRIPATNLPFEAEQIEKFFVSSPLGA